MVICWLGGGGGGGAVNDPGTPLCRWLQGGGGRDEGGEVAGRWSEQLNKGCLLCALEGGREETGGLLSLGLSPV